MHSLRSALVVGLCLGLSIIWGAKMIASPQPAATLAVTGEAKVDTLPQIANFNASVSIFNVDKETAVNEVNTRMTDLIAAVKEFGIADKDITTQQVSVYEVNGGPEIMIFPPRPTQQGWQASNSIEITLRDIGRASALTDLLNADGTTAVSGPNFRMDDSDDIETSLLKEAIDDARQKAQVTAEAAGRRLGKVITVSADSAMIAPMYSRSLETMSGDFASAPIEPGTQTSRLYVTVIFALK